MNLSVHAPNEKWVENFARFGIASKGITFILIGIVSAITAFQGGNKGLDKKDVVQEIWKQPYGHVLLVIMVLGFLGYVMWRWIQAFKDPEHKGTDTKGIAKRTSYAVSGLIYASLAYYCIKLLIGSSQNGHKKQSIMNSLLDHTGGQILFVLIGVIVIGYGIYQIYQGFTNKFKDEVNDSGVNTQVRSFYTLLGKFGFIARGVVLIAIGFFLGKAGLHANAKEVEGSDGVLSYFYQQGGPLLMGLIAIGLAGYGLFMLVKARYQSMHL